MQMFFGKKIVPCAILPGIERCLPVKEDQSPSRSYCVEQNRACKPRFGKLLRYAFGQDLIVYVSKKFQLNDPVPHRSIFYFQEKVSHVANCFNLYKLEETLREPVINQTTTYEIPPISDTHKHTNCLSLFIDIDRQRVYGDKTLSAFDIIL
jgi:hypothetical protein